MANAEFNRKCDANKIILNAFVTYSGPIARSPTQSAMLIFTLLPDNWPFI